MVCDGIDGPFSSMIYLSNILDSGCLPFSSHARRFCSHDDCHGSCTLIEMPVALLNHLDSWQSHFYFIFISLVSTHGRIAILFRICLSMAGQAFQAVFLRLFQPLGGGVREPKSYPNTCQTSSNQSFRLLWIQAVFRFPAMHVGFAAMTIVMVPVL